MQEKLGKVNNIFLPQMANQPKVDCVPSLSNEIDLELNSFNDPGHEEERSKIMMFRNIMWTWV